MGAGAAGFPEKSMPSVPILFIELILSSAVRSQSGTMSPNPGSERAMCCLLWERREAPVPAPSSEDLGEALVALVRGPVLWGLESCHPDGRQLYLLPS